MPPLLCCRAPCINFDSAGVWGTRPQVDDAGAVVGLLTRESIVQSMAQALEASTSSISSMEQSVTNSLD